MEGGQRTRLESISEEEMTPPNATREGEELPIGHKDRPLSGTIYEQLNWFLARVGEFGPQDLSDHAYKIKDSDAYKAFRSEKGLLESVLAICEAENADARAKYKLAVNDQSPESMAICAAAGMAAERIATAVRALNATSAQNPAAGGATGKDLPSLAPKPELPSFAGLALPVRYEYISYEGDFFLDRNDNEITAEQIVAALNGNATGADK